MKREIPPAILASFLVLGCVGFRLLSNLFPAFIPNISPLMAVAFIGAMYLPGAGGWLVGPSTLLVTDLAFVTVNYQTEGTMFSWWTVVSFLVYALAGGLGLLISRQKSLPKIMAGSVVCSLLFYLVANTFSWWTYLAPLASPGYAPNWSGWWQANTVGLPGWAPTWLFLRHAVLGDLFFSLLLLLVLDRSLLWNSNRLVARTA